MADRYVFNPLTGQMDIAGEGTGGGNSETANWEHNVTSPVWPDGASTKGLTAMQILQKMLIKDTLPAVSLRSTVAGGIREAGDKVTTSFTAKPIQGTYSLASMSLKAYSGGKLINSEDSVSIESGVDYKFSKYMTITDTTRVYVEISDTKGLTAKSGDITYTFGHKLYTGFATLATLATIDTNWLESNLSAVLATGRAVSKTTSKLNYPSGYFYIALPVAWGCSIDSIYDAAANASGFMICLGDKSLENKYGVRTNYRIFVSEQEQTGDVTYLIK